MWRTKAHGRPAKPGKPGKKRRAYKSWSCYVAFFGLERGKSMVNGDDSRDGHCVIRARYKLAYELQFKESYGTDAT